MTFQPFPCMQEAYESLMIGKNICLEDGDVYLSLLANEEELRAIFGGCGHTLVKHDRGFFYFEGTRCPAKAVEILAFMAILCEHLDEGGFPVEKTLETRVFLFKELPHLRHQRYAEITERAGGVVTEDDLEKVVDALRKQGFASKVGADAFRFRVPVARLLEMVGKAKGSLDERAAADAGDGGAA
jgi:hypothetical protein